MGKTTFFYFPPGAQPPRKEQKPALATQWIMRNIHIGQIIHKKFKESGLSVAEFASRINRTRGTIYDIFSRKSIDTDLLIIISDVLQYDFFQEYYQQKDHPQSPTQICHIHFNVEGITDAKLLCQYLAPCKKK